MTPEQELTVRRDLRVFREMAAENQRDAIKAEGGIKWRDADRLWERHHACLWALRELDPAIEGPRQIMTDIAKAAE